MAMSELKTKPTGQSVVEFINQVEDPVKREDCFKLLELMEEVTGKKPRMWGSSIVGFDSYVYKYASGKTGEWPVIGFSPRKQNLSLYIMPGFSKYEELLSKLGKHKLGKSCLYVKRLADVDWPTLRELAVQSVQYMHETYP
jgi:Domain of unknown function (DU1801)